MSKYRISFEMATAQQVAKWSSDGLDVVIDSEFEELESRWQEVGKATVPNHYNRVDFDNAMFNYNFFADELAILRAERDYRHCGELLPSGD